ncbi:MAG: hypothetical protein WC707_02210 [Candidatus Babeliaceae bacterium]|jgi:cytidine deaminase
MLKIDKNLINAALHARNNAQSPYSKYSVGAAVQSKSGAIYAGCNVERCSYTQTTHAEQNAIDNMIAAEGSVKIERIVIVAAPADVRCALSDFENSIINTIMTGGCCGHCLQIIWENCYNDTAVEIYFLRQDATITATTIGTLLPYPFGPSDLGIYYGEII